MQIESWAGDATNRLEQSLQANRSALDGMHSSLRALAEMQPEQKGPLQELQAWLDDGHAKIQPTQEIVA